MSIVGTRNVLAAAGNAGVDPVYVDDVFSAYTYNGNGGTGTNAASQDIVNGIDLDDKGGLVWLKWRSAGGYGSSDNVLFDTERGINKFIRSNTAAVEVNTGTGANASLYAFNSDGFSLGTDVLYGRAHTVSPSKMISWTFRKQEKFFDIVTYTGDGGNGRNIPHNLGSVPGAVFFKRTGGTDPGGDGSGSNWRVSHRSMATNFTLGLNLTSAAQQFSITGSGNTDSNLNVNGNVNNNGTTYVAYLFAHNNNDGEFGEDGDEDIIKCDSYTGSGNSTNKFITLGFEPQFVMIKNITDAGGNWNVMDAQRGVAFFGPDAVLRWNDPDVEVIGDNELHFTPTGFKLNDRQTQFNDSGKTYIYIAIARSSKPIESSSEGFNVKTRVGTNHHSGGPNYITGFPVDMYIRKYNNENDLGVRALSVAGVSLRTEDIDNPATGTPQFNLSSQHIDQMTGMQKNQSTRSDVYGYMWKRAPKFFDVVTYEGNGSGMGVYHNLGVAPEMIWIRSTNVGYDWAVGIKSIQDAAYAASSSSDIHLVLNTTAASVTGQGRFGNSNDNMNSDYFYVGYSNQTNKNTKRYVAMLFASLAGVSKVGTYTGNGSSQDIDCGFSNGAKFFLVKASNAIGNWCVFDTVRGINIGNDPYFILNAAGAADTDEDAVDTHAPGITVNEVSGSNINTNNVSYLFYAIAT